VDRLTGWLAQPFFLYFLCLSLTAESDLQIQVDDLEAKVGILQKELNAVKTVATQKKANAFNPSISVVGDVLGAYRLAEEESEAHKGEHAGHGHEVGHDHEWTNGVLVREVELEFRGAIDPWADAVFAIAIEQTKLRKFAIHLEEAYINLKRIPGLGFSPFGMNIKAGQFLASFGRMNRIHLHNIPQITYPLALQTFLGDEGLKGQGVSLNFSVPTGAKSALNFWFEGVTGGGLPIQTDGASEVPMAVGHAWWFFNPAPNHYLDIGLSGLIGRKGEAGSGALYLLGSDIHYSYKPSGYGQNPIFLFGNEFFAANALGNEKSWPMGNFTWAQVNLVGNSFLGARYDIAPKEGHLDVYFILYKWRYWWFMAVFFNVLD
jgi:hypothetical protein